MAAALDYLTRHRFDLPAKTLYARFRDRELESDWGEWVYAHHLKVWNGYHEREPNKSCLADFQNRFDSILDAVKTGQFDFSRSPVPVSPAGIPLDGGHRLAAALYYDKEIEVATRDEKTRDWNYDYFLEKKNILPTGLLPQAADAMAIELCRLRAGRRDLHLVSVFPSAQGEEGKIQRILGSHGQVFYRKEVHLTENGVSNLLFQTSGEEPWGGPVRDGLQSARLEAKRLLAGPGPVRVYLVQADGIDALTAAQQQIRDLFQIDHHSVHITETHRQTRLLADLLFNQTSVQFMNTATLRPGFKHFWQLLGECHAEVKEQGIDPQEMCIGGSAALAAYGLRDVKDFDLVHGRGCAPPEVGKHGPSLGEWAQHYPVPADDIVYNPSRHFHFCGQRFASLDVLREARIHRWEKKDRRDVEMINRFELETAYRLPEPLARPPVSRAATHVKKLLRSIKRRTSIDS